jgi:hypothetical protein
MVDVNGKMHQVRCKVCNKIEGKEKLLAPNLDSLWKHGSKKKIITIFEGSINLVSTTWTKIWFILRMNACKW